MTALGSWFALFLVLGTPVAFALGAASTVYLYLYMDLPLSVVPQRLFGGLDQFILMSMPFFILSGLLMNQSGLTERLVQFAQYLVGSWRAGLAQVNVVTSMFFGGITGAATADTAAVGSILIPSMVRAGYRRDYSTALTAASSIIGPLIPPSIPMLVYAISAETSVAALFLVGVTPGIAVGLTMMLYNRLMVPVISSPDPSSSVADEERGKAEIMSAATATSVAESHSEGTTPVETFGSSLRAAALALVMPLIIVGGVVGGVFTPTESAVVAVFYAAIVGLFILRTLTWKMVMQAVLETSIVSVTVLLVIGFSNLFGWVLSFEQIPQQIAALFTQLTDIPSVFLLMVIVILLIAGLFLEPSGAIIILTPVLLPTARSFGFDPIHFGLITVFGLVIGLITPPVGLCLFVGASVGQVSIVRLTRAVVPYLLILIAVYVIFAFFPQLALWLPNWLLK